MSLSTHTDWRDVADAAKDWPRCKNCGDVYGNVAFGTKHYTRGLGREDACPGYESVEEQSTDTKSR